MVDATGAVVPGAAMRQHPTNTAPASQERVIWNQEAGAFVVPAPVTQPLAPLGSAHDCRTAPEEGSTSSKKASAVPVVAGSAAVPSPMRRAMIDVDSGAVFTCCVEHGSGVLVVVRELDGVVVRELDGVRVPDDEGVPVRDDDGVDVRVPEAEDVLLGVFVGVVDDDGVTLGEPDVEDVPVGDNPGGSELVMEADAVPV